MTAPTTEPYVAAEHEFEAEPGLPEPLPRGERLLWQGSPDWRVMAREAMHTRLLAIYFTLLLAASAASTLASGGSFLDAAQSVLTLLPLAGLALGALSLMGWLIARTTVYTVTDKRVVMRVGVVLSITFNLPHAQIESAGLRTNADGSGDLTLALAGTDRIAYAHLWPHVRPWRVKHTQPMLRALPDAQRVATILAAALAEAAGATAPAIAAPASESSTPARIAPAAGSGRQPEPVAAQGARLSGTVATKAAAANLLQRDAMNIGSDTTVLRAARTARSATDPAAVLPDTMPAPRPLPTTSRSARAPLLALAALVLASLLALATVRITGVGAVKVPDAAVVTVREFRFEDRPDGSIAVLDASGQHVVDTVAPGSNGFLRGTMRGLARERKRQAVGADIPFRMIGRADGKLTLEDPATGRRVDLGSFGPTNAAVFAKIMASPVR